MTFLQSKTQLRKALRIWVITMTLLYAFVLSALIASNRDIGWLWLLHILTPIGMFFAMVLDTALLDPTFNYKSKDELLALSEVYDLNILDAELEAHYNWLVDNGNKALMESIKHVFYAKADTVAEVRKSIKKVITDREKLKVL